MMKKIKAIKSDFYEGCGPAETITLGITDDSGQSYILGTFYFGPNMAKTTESLYQKTEAFIDTVIKAVGNDGNKAL